MLTCTFTQAKNKYATEGYGGVINKFGVAIAVTGKTLIVWIVIAADEDKIQLGASAGT
ncbi:MAG: DUF992 domain-containing protein [Rhizobiaceae bacterium]